MQTSKCLTEAQNNCTRMVALSGKLDFMMVVLFWICGVFPFGTALNPVCYLHAIIENSCMNILENTRSTH